MGIVQSIALVAATALVCVTWAHTTHLKLSTKRAMTAAEWAAEFLFNAAKIKCAASDVIGAAESCKCFQSFTLLAGG